MKKTLIIGLLILSHSVFGQIPGKRVDGPLVIFDTLTIKTGDVIFMGKGSDANSGDFVHITTPKKYMTDFSSDMGYSEWKSTSQGISSSYNGRSYAIEYFSKVSSAKNEEVILGVIAIGKSFDGKLDLGVYKQAVNFEAAIQAGEIIKINEIEFAKSSRTINIPHFEFGKEGVKPIVVAFDGVNKEELFAGTLNWYNEYYKNKSENILSAVENEKVGIAGVKKGVFISKIVGVDLFGDVEYRFLIEFKENEISMNFITGGEDGQITEDVSQEDYFDKNGKIRKMYADFKTNMEQMMDEISFSLVDYLSK